MKLSILICSLESRQEQLNELLSELQHQISSGHFKSSVNGNMMFLRFEHIEVIICTDNKQLSVGAKRNLLIEQARGEYITFIDDDDRITPDYIDSLLQGIKQGYDSIVFDVMYNPKGGTPKLVKYSCKMRDRELVTHFERATNHLMCTKRDIVKQVPFKNINFGEDADFAKRLVKLIKTEGQIDKVLYYYDFDMGKSETR